MKGLTKLPERWSFATNDIEDVDAYDRAPDHCEQCSDLVDEDVVVFDDGEPYCPDCFKDVFGFLPGYDSDDSRKRETDE